MESAKLHWWLRRLHSLSGVVPLAAFLIQHLIGNSFTILGQEEYDHHVEFLIGLPFVVVIEATTIWAPLAFHAALGIAFTFNAKWNPSEYAYQRNFMYVLQRVTGIVTLIFVIQHLATTRFGLSEAQKHSMFETMLLYFSDNTFLVLFYIVGFVAAAFHMCNGLWSFCIMWGITITKKTQHAVFMGAMGLFGLLTLMSLLTMLQLSGWWDISGDYDRIKSEYERDNIPFNLENFQGIDANHEDGGHASTGFELNDPFAHQA